MTDGQPNSGGLGQHCPAGYGRGWGVDAAAASGTTWAAAVGVSVGLSVLSAVPARTVFSSCQSEQNLLQHLP